MLCINLLVLNCFLVFMVFLFSLLTSHLPCHTSGMIGLSTSGWTLLSLNLHSVMFPLLQVTLTPCYSQGKYQVWTKLLVPTLPWYQALRFLIVGVCEVLCFQNIHQCRWNPLYKDNLRNPKCGNPHVHLYICRTGLWASCDRGHYGFRCWDGLIHTYTFWVMEQFAKHCIFPSVSVTM